MTIDAESGIDYCETTMSEVKAFKKWFEEISQSYSRLSPLELSALILDSGAEGRVALDLFLLCLYDSGQLGTADRSEEMLQHMCFLEAVTFGESFVLEGMGDNNE